MSEREALEQQAVSALLSQSVSDETDAVKKASGQGYFEGAEGVGSPQHKSSSSEQQQIHSGNQIHTSVGKTSPKKAVGSSIAPYQKARDDSKESSRKKKKDAAAGEKAAKVYRLTNQLSHETEIADGFYDPGRDTEPLPPLASFYRHNNFGREVIVVDTQTDLDLALAVAEAQKEVGALLCQLSAKSLLDSVGNCNIEAM